MGFLYWFAPNPADKWEIIEPADDEAFASELYSRMMLTLRGGQPVEILCEDASRLSPAVFNAFLNPVLEPLCRLVIGLRFRHLTSANAQSLKPLVEKMPGLNSLELLKGFTLDCECVDVLSGLPKLEELAADELEWSEKTSWWHVIESLPKLKALERLAVPRCFLLEPEIDALIKNCDLVELAVANAYDEDGNQAIQDKYEYCKIDWGYLP